MHHKEVTIQFCCRLAEANLFAFLYKTDLSAPPAPAKVGDCKSILFPENSCVVEIKNTWLILLSHFTLLGGQPAFWCCLSLRK